LLIGKTGKTEVAGYEITIEDVEISTKISQDGRCKRRQNNCGIRFDTNGN
jgi:hypothetical protein